MGQDKASLPIHGSNLLSWQESQYRQAGFPVISRLSDVYSGYCGPLAGIHAACCHHGEVSAFVVVPVDMPQLELTTIYTLIKHGQEKNTAVCFDQSPLPIYLPNNPALKQTLQQWLADPNGKRSVYALMQELEGEWLAVEDDQQLININTPEQWQAYQLGVKNL